jgi:hypothetical protein
VQSAVDRDEGNQEGGARSRHPRQRSRWGLRLTRSDVRVRAVTVAGGLEKFCGTGSQNIEIIGSNLFTEPLQNVFFKNNFSRIFFLFVGVFLGQCLKGRGGSGNSTVGIRVTTTNRSTEMCKPCVGSHVR